MNIKGEKLSCLLITKIKLNKTVTGKKKKSRYHHTIDNNELVQTLRPCNEATPSYVIMMHGALYCFREVKFVLVLFLDDAETDGQRDA